MRSTRATVMPDSGSANFVHATGTVLTRAYAMAPGAVPGTPATVRTPLAGAEASRRTVVKTAAALPARSVPVSVKRWQPSGSPEITPVPETVTADSGSNVPHAPAAIGAKVRTSVLDPMPDSASE